MDPLAGERRWLLAAEVAANLAEVARWDWTDETQTAAKAARHLADRIYHEQAPSDVAEIVDHLTDAFGGRMRDSVDAILYRFADEASPLGLSEMRRRARSAFFTLRADLYPEGREWAA